MRLRSFVLLALAAVSTTTHAQTSDAGSRFDGDWLVTMACPTNTEESAARGYKRQFPAQVKDGVLTGEDGTAGGPGWLRIAGAIGGDGSARLNARGRTGNPEYAVDHPPQSSPYAFHIEARFDGAHGTGRRVEARVCTFAFDRK